MPGDANEISSFAGNNAVGNGILTAFTESSAHNASSSDNMDNDSASFLRDTSNGHAGLNLSENGLSVSTEDITSMEKSDLIEELVETLRETYERMPAHLLQYELIKAKAMSAVKFT